MSLQARWPGGSLDICRDKDQRVAIEKSGPYPRSAAVFTRHDRPWKPTSSRSSASGSPSWVAPQSAEQSAFRPSAHLAITRVTHFLPRAGVIVRARRARFQLIAARGSGSLPQSHVTLIRISMLSEPAEVFREQLASGIPPHLLSQWLKRHKDDAGDRAKRVDRAGVLTGVLTFDHRDAPSPRVVSKRLSLCVLGGACVNSAVVMRNEIDQVVHRYPFPRRHENHTAQEGVVLHIDRPTFRPRIGIEGVVGVPMLRVRRWGDVVEAIPDLQAAGPIHRVDQRFPLKEQLAKQPRGIHEVVLTLAELHAFPKIVKRLKEELVRCHSAILERCSLLPRPGSSRSHGFSSMTTTISAARSADAAAREQRCLHAEQCDTLVLSRSS
jgi:hypothetical protein